MPEKTSPQNRTVIIKTPEEIEKMRVAGKLAAEVLQMIEPHVKPGITTEALDALCHRYIVETQKAIPAPLGYMGYPKSVCTSVNHVVCHGIPNNRPLKKGDIINIDVTVIKDGYHGDTSKMFLVGGEASILAKRLCQITQECLYRGIKLVKPGRHLGDIGAAIETHAHANGFSVVRDFCGHGIGKGFHEEPNVLHFGTPNTGLVLEPFMTFTIEPMINAGTYHVKTLPDNWTTVTKDRKLSAQFEHTIAVTETGYEILTLRLEETELISRTEKNTTQAAK